MDLINLNDIKVDNQSNPTRQDDGGAQEWNADGLAFGDDKGDGGSDTDSLETAVAGQARRKRETTLEAVSFQGVIRRNDESSKGDAKRALLEGSGTAGALEKEDEMAKSIVVGTEPNLSEIAGSMGNNEENFDDDDFDIFQPKQRQSRATIVGGPAAKGGEVNQSLALDQSLANMSAITMSADFTIPAGRNPQSQINSLNSTLISQVSSPADNDLPSQFNDKLQEVHRAFQKGKFNEAV